MYNMYLRRLWNHLGHNLAIFHNKNIFLILRHDNMPIYYTTHTSISVYLHNDTQKATYMKPIIFETMNVLI